MLRPNVAASSNPPSPSPWKRASEPSKEEPSVSFLLTLLTMLDFSEPGTVANEDWERGMSNLWCPGLSVNHSWGALLSRFDKAQRGAIDFGELHGLAPLEPRLAGLLRVVVQTLVRLSERVEVVAGDLHREKMKTVRNAINFWRNKLQVLAFEAWRRQVRLDRERRKTVVAVMKYRPCRGCLWAMRDLVALRRSQLQRASEMLQGTEKRLLRQVFGGWVQSMDELTEHRYQKLSGFLEGRDAWWRVHVWQTWQSWMQRERVIRRFVGRWCPHQIKHGFLPFHLCTVAAQVPPFNTRRHKGSANIFLVWRRTTQRAVETRTLNLSRRLQRWLEGFLRHSYLGWKGAARDKRAMRECLVTDHRVRRSAVLCRQIFEQWHAFRETARVTRRHALGRCSLLGAAWRGWLHLVNENSRERMLHWLLGPGLSALDTGLQTAAAGLQQRVEDSSREIKDAMREASERQQQYTAGEVNELRAALVDRPTNAQVAEMTALAWRMQDEMRVLRDQLEHQAQAQLEASELGVGSAKMLREDLNSLAHEMGEKLSSATNELKKVSMDEKARVDRVSGEVERMHTGKASHQELMRLVTSLQQRPAAGHPASVQSLLTVPYPMPPPAASPRSRPASASPRSTRTGGAVAAGGELREIPIDLRTGDTGSSVRGSEQITISEIPIDAQLSHSNPYLHQAPPFPSHSPIFYTRSAGRRPASARSSRSASAMAHVDRFENKTNRLARSLDEGGARCFAVGGKACRPRSDMQQVSDALERQAADLREFAMASEQAPAGSESWELDPMEPA